MIRLRDLMLLVAIVISNQLVLAQKEHNGHCLGTGHELGLAVDLGALNDKPVSLYYSDPEVKKMVEKTQYIFNHPKDGGAPPSENYGPAGLYRNGKKFFDKKLQADHRDHFHIRY